MVAKDAELSPTRVGRLGGKSLVGATVRFHMDGHIFKGVIGEG